MLKPTVQLMPINVEEINNHLKDFHELLEILEHLFETVLDQRDDYSYIDKEDPDLFVVPAWSELWDVLDSLDDYYSAYRE